MARRIRQAFTLIELLVVLAIISMILSLAAPAVMGLLRTTSIVAATDVLRSAVSSTRSSAVSSRKSCSVDIRYGMSGDGKSIVTDCVSTSAILTAEAFEPYDDGKAEDPPAAGGISEFMKNWKFFPEEDAWEVYSQQTRELWVGRKKDNIGDIHSGNAYAWSLNSRTSEERAVDVETMTIARFRARQVTDRRMEWRFGLLSNFTRSSSDCFGYRFAVRVVTTDTGWNTHSKAQIEKVHCPSNPVNENFYEASDVDTTDDHVPVREIDRLGEGDTAAITPGVWYWMKMRMSRVQKMVTLTGKVWVEGSPEPASWTVGPVYDRWSDSSASAIYVDNFGPGGEPFAGGFSGVWTYGAEIAVDDFSVDWRNTWLLPKGILMQPKQYAPTDPDRDSYDLVSLGRYEPGSFPLSYRPDGTTASEQSVLLVITNISSGDRRAVLIDRNTGRVEAADDLRITQ